MNFYNKFPNASASNSRKRFETVNLYDTIDLTTYGYTSNFILPPLSTKELDEYYKNNVGISSSTPGAYGR